jgi:hypothetical protein
VDERLVLPTNSLVRLLVTSADVIHSWAVPSLGVKIDAIPGRLNQVRVLKVVMHGLRQRFAQAVTQGVCLWGGGELCCRPALKNVHSAAHIHAVLLLVVVWL